MSDKPVTLVVDLDGTLIHTDLMVECLLAVLKQNLLLLLLMPLWLLRGRASFKRELAQRAHLDVTSLPYNDLVLDCIHSARGEGRPVMLSTGSDELLANPVAEHLKVFDLVQASDGLRNLTGENKRDALTELYGEGGFDYIGNSSADIPVWSRARECVAVCQPSERSRLEKGITLDRVLVPARGGIKRWLKALRIHQWLKNLLLFVPLLLSHNYGATPLIVSVLLAFVTFSLCSSTVYVLNDLLDLPHDRRHPSKCQRPFASGELPVLSGLMLAPVLMITVIALLSVQPAAFAQVTAIYFVITCGYSLVLKRIAIVDVLTLAGLYTLRIIAGGAVLGIAVSFWLLAFSMFIFMSLALLKRYAELLENSPEEPLARLSGRGYARSDAGFLAALGAASGYSSVVVMAMYINSDIVIQLYSARDLLWFVCPVLLFWISHMWFAAHRGVMHDDPIIFAVKDMVSLVSAAGLGILFYLAL